LIENALIAGVCKHFDEVLGVSRNQNPIEVEDLAFDLQCLLFTRVFLIFDFISLSVVLVVRQFGQTFVFKFILGKIYIFI
jgi:hypothetical protein